MQGVWKVSVFDEDLTGFEIRAYCLKESDAKEITKELDVLGFIARASKHKNKKGDYYYGE